MEEATQSGTHVITVKATDQDKGHNGQVRYSIVQQPNQKGTKFVVDEITGEIKTNKVFDREGDDGRFVSLTVKATDRGTPPLEGVCSFKVEITDINDNVSDALFWNVVVKKTKPFYPFSRHRSSTGRSTRSTSARTPPSAPTSSASLPPTRTPT